MYSIFFLMLLQRSSVGIHLFVISAQSLWKIGQVWKDPDKPEVSEVRSLLNRPKEMRAHTWSNFNDPLYADTHTHTHTHIPLSGCCITLSASSLVCDPVTLFSLAINRGRVKTFHAVCHWVTTQSNFSS